MRFLFFDERPDPAQEVSDIRQFSMWKWVVNPTQSENCTDRCSSQFNNNYFTEMCSGSEEGSYLRLIDLNITQL